MVESRPGDGVKMIEIGDYAVVPRPLLDADVNGLGAYDALGPDLSVLAISDRARSALLGEGDRLLDEPTYAAAAGCLGNDVVAARMVPDKQLLSIETGIDMVAIGLTAGGNVLCALGGSPERADEVEKALRVSLAPDARDPVTGEAAERLGRWSRGDARKRSAKWRLSAPSSSSRPAPTRASCSRRSRPGASSRSSTATRRASCLDRTLTQEN